MKQVQILAGIFSQGKRQKHQMLIKTRGQK